MTNGAVAQQVQKVEGNTLQVKYKDGEKTIVVPSGAEVVNLVAGGFRHGEYGIPPAIPSGAHRSMVPAQLPMHWSPCIGERHGRRHQPL
jgi:hypothetical protein